MIIADTTVSDEFIDITSTLPFDFHQESLVFVKTLLNDDDIKLLEKVCSAFALYLFSELS